MLAIRIASKHHACTLFELEKKVEPALTALSNCNVCGVRTTTVRDVTMMYCQKRYMENVPLWVSKIVKLFTNVPGFSRELIGLVATTEL